MGQNKKVVYSSSLLSGKVLIAAFAMCTSFVACSSNDQSTEGHEETMTQNAAQAEAEEARLANADQPKEAKTSKSAKAETKTAKNDKKADKKVAGHKAEKADKAAKTEKVAKADKAALKSEKNDEKVVVAKAEPKAAAPKAHRIPASAGGVYVVQVGAFKVKENADKLEAKLKTAGFPVEVHSIEHSKNGLLHLVQLAPVANRAEAETAIEELQAKQDLRAQLVFATAEAH